MHACMHAFNKNIEGNDESNDDTSQVCCRQKRITIFRCCTAFISNYLFLSLTLIFNMSLIKNKNPKT